MNSSVQKYYIEDSVG